MFLFTFSVNCCHFMIMLLKVHTYNCHKIWLILGSTIFKKNILVECHFIILLNAVKGGNNVFYTLASCQLQLKLSSFCTLIKRI